VTSEALLSRPWEGPSAELQNLNSASNLALIPRIAEATADCSHAADDSDNSVLGVELEHRTELGGGACAIIEAGHCGLADELARGFPRRQSP
jgi:hypothetical protein